MKQHFFVEFTNFKLGIILRSHMPFGYFRTFNAWQNFSRDTSEFSLICFLYETYLTILYASHSFLQRLYYQAFSFFRSLPFQLHDKSVFYLYYSRELFLCKISAKVIQFSAALLYFYVYKWEIQENKNLSNYVHILLNWLNFWYIYDYKYIYAIS